MSLSMAMKDWEAAVVWGLKLVGELEARLAWWDTVSITPFSSDSAPTAVRHCSQFARWARVLWDCEACEPVGMNHRLKADTGRSILVLVFVFVLALALLLSPCC
jgi:hypothetical protein